MRRESNLSDQEITDYWLKFEAERPELFLRVFNYVPPGDDDDGRSNYQIVVSWLRTLDDGKAGWRHYDSIAHDMWMMLGDLRKSRRK